MATYTGTAGNDSWTLVAGGTFTLDGLGGTDTLYMGTSLRSSYTITKATDGSVHIDSISAASGGLPLHATLNNMETLVFANKTDTLNLLTYFGSAMSGTPGNDTFISTSTNDSIDGGTGIDTVVYNANHAPFSIARTATGFTVADTSGAYGLDSLQNVERLKFSDVSIALDLDGHAGQAAKLLATVFGTASVSIKEYVGIALTLLDSGMSYEQVAAAAISATGKVSNSDIAALLWTNLFGVAPSVGDLAPVVAMMDGGTSAAALTVLVAESSITAQHINLVGLSQTGLIFI